VEFATKRRLHWKRTLNKQYVEQNYGSLQFNINGEFKTGKLTHKLLAGADADYLQADTYTYQLQKQDGTYADAGNNFSYGTNGNTSNGNISLTDEILGLLDILQILRKKTLQEFLQEELVFTYKI
jgi:iron complex outermembrane receptor protein